MAIDFNMEFPESSDLTNDQRVKRLLKNGMLSAINSCVKTIAESTEFDDLSEDHQKNLKSVALARFRNTLWPAKDAPERAIFDKKMTALGYDMNMLVSKIAGK